MAKTKQELEELKRQVNLLKQDLMNQMKMKLEVLQVVLIQRILNIMLNGK